MAFPYLHKDGFNLQKLWPLLLIILLGLSSFFLLFYNLGCRSLWGSEGRWAEVVRQMFLNRDFFHPQINGEPYFDKPLFTYWAIAVFTPLFGELNEFVARLPSALSGLCTILGTFYLGQKLWNNTVAFYASFILLTSFGFIFWSRTAAADTENLAFIIAAICWYIRFQDQSSYLTYIIFYLICAIGSQFKGLTAAAVPAAVVLCHLMVYKNWKQHLNIKNIIAFFTGATVYILPFVYAKVTSQHYGQEGLSLAFRENIVRFFKAFDHKEPFYVYLYYVPLLMLPWFFLLTGYISDKINGYKHMTKQEKWLAASFATIFLLFTLSSSRRSYYILPILPFGALGIATFLASPFNHRIWRFSLTLQALSLLIVSGIGTANLFVWPVIQKINGYTPPPTLPSSIAIFSMIAIFPLMTFFGVKDHTGIRSLRPFLLIVASIALWAGFFCNWQCQLERDRPLKAFVQKLRMLTENISASSIALSKNMASVAFYLDKKKPVVSLEKKENIEPFLLKKDIKVLITRKKDLKRLLPYLAGCQMELLISCPSPKWDRRTNKRLEAWKITGSCVHKIISK